MSRGRKTAIAVVVWLVLFEGAAWVADAAWGFRYELLDGIATAARQTQPVPETEPDWPARAIRVRVPDRGEPRAEPYALGGRVIEDAWPDAKQEWLFPEELADDPRPRVFVVGGSAPLGYPYAYEDGFARRLAERLPDHRVENVGQAGWTSGQVLGAVDRLLAHFAPDVLVVYSGNNEWIRWAPDPAARGLDLEWQRGLSHSRALAAALWLGHGLRSRAPPSGEAPPLIGWRHAHAHPDRGLDVAAWRAERATHLRAYRDHLVAMRERARARGVRVIFCTVPFNYRLSPSFKHRQPDAFDADRADEVRGHLDDAAAALEADDPAGALAAADAAAALDDGPALVHYLRGVALEALERPADAEAAYARSREQMVGNLGVRLSVNRIIREVAVGEGVERLDLRRRFDAWEHARGHHFNRDLIHDDCHPTPRGHRLIAGWLADRLR
ncbi:MAG TPA: hypothetical protein RMH99_24080 [Sandaracinaceae bacterium LLY-WYZ-13_1]|nr:hypothetical protein [Sandaracinaceae bacterium LLY-WYZ-13_1]